MNQIYKSLWNESTGSYVAVPETATAAGQQVSSARAGRRALSRTQTQRLVLEPRIVFDGALPVAVVDMMDTTTQFVDSDAENPTVEAEIVENPTVEVVTTTSDNEQDALAPEERAVIDGTLAATNLTSTEIIFIDAIVSDLEAYITDHPNADVVLIDSTKDGLEQIAAVLAGRTDITAIHILSHGAAGQLSLGNALVDLQSINGEHADELAAINKALSADADILIYGCDVAAGEAGQAFVNALASATGADIAASTDSTGSADLGGDWDLEAQTAAVEAQALALTDWQGELLYTNTSVGGAWAISAPANTAVTPVTLTNTTDGITTTIQLSGIANTWTTTATETLNNIAAFSNGAQNTADFATLFNTTGTANATGTITITFSKAVTNPIIHLDRLGGTSNASGSFLTIGPVITLTTAGATLTKVAGSSHFEVTATTIQQTPGVATGNFGQSGLTPATGTSAGSVQVNGTYTTLTFTVTAFNGAVSVNGPNTDGFEMALAIDAPPVTNNDTFTINKGATLTANLYANNGSGVDSDVRGDTMTINRINGATFTVGTPIVLPYGSLTITNATTGAFTFTPNANYTDGQYFTYSVSDAAGNVSNSSTVTINADTDSDGIVNRTDLDDDNDGILDTNEGLVVQTPIARPPLDPSATPQVVANGAFTTTYTENTSNVTLYTSNGGSIPFGATSNTIPGFDLGLAGAKLTTAFAPVVTDLIFSIGDLDLGKVISLEVYDKNGVLIDDITPYIVYMSNTVTSGNGTQSALITTTNRDLTAGSFTFLPNAHIDFYLQGIEVSRVVANTVSTSGGGTAELYFISASTVRDTDIDGVSDHLDLDSDNDGISDLYESTGGVGDALADTNFNGTVSLAESIAAGATGDGDIDNDGLMDIFDANTANATGAASLGNTPINTDGDALADYLDLDSDNDTIADAVEARLTAGYVAYTGTVDTNDDLDNDGVVDIFDSSNGVGGTFGGNFGTPVNTDGTFTVGADTLQDYRDTDSDGDGLLDSVENDTPVIATTVFTYVDPDGSVTTPSVSLENQYGDTSEVAYRERVPLAVTDTYTMAEDSGPLTLLPLTTGVDDSDPAGLAITITSINGTTLTPGTAQIIAVPNGTVNVTAGGAISFTPTLNYVGTSTFAYVITNSKGGTATANQVVTITAVNDLPVDGNETNTVTEDVTLSVAAAAGLLANATDVDGGALTISAFSVAGQVGPFVVGTGYVIASVGTVTINANGSYSFAPVANYNGLIPVVTYTVSDGAGGTDTSTLTLTMTPVNDDFTDADESLTVAEDSGATTGTLLTGTSSVDGPVTVQSFAVAGQAGPFVVGTAYAITGVGSITVNADGTYSFTPNANYNGTVPVITYVLTDGSGLTDSSTLSITVTPVNDAPVAVDDTNNVPINGSVSGNVLTNDTDVDGNPLTVTAALVDTNGDGTPNVLTIGTATAITDNLGSPIGTLTLNANGSYTFVPAANYAGSVPVITYTVSDGALTDTGTLTLTMGANTPPVAIDDSLPVTEDTPVSGNVLTNDTDADGNPLTVTAAQVDTNGDGTPDVLTIGTLTPITYNLGSPIGTLTLNSNGSFTFTPAPNYFGPVPVITYTVSDGLGGTDTANLTLGPVTSVDDLPIAVDDTIAATEDTPITGSLSGNDTPSGDGGNVWSLATPATNGTVTVSAAGVYNYTPNANYVGTDSFTYSITDVDGSTSTATVNITVAAVNDAPIAVDDTIAATEDTPITGSLSGNDTPSGDGGNVWSLATPATNGTVTVSATGVYNYTPNANYVGADSFTYSITDIDGSTSTATVNITVAAVDDVPVAVDDVIKTNEDTPVVLNLLGNDTDPDGDPLTLTSINGTPITPGIGQTIDVPNGTVTVSVEGVVTFTPAFNYSGPIQFSYEVQDPSGAIGRAFVAVNVAPVDDAVLFEQLLPHPINFGEYYYPAEYHWETLNLPESMPQDLFVTYSVQESQNQVAKNSALGTFNADAPTANELSNFTFDLKGLPVGMDPNLFVQHAVRGVPVTPEPNLFVQNAVRQSQAESMARNIGVTSFNTATSGVVSMLNPFEIGSPHGAIDLSIDGVQGEFAKKSTTGTDAAALSDPKVDDLASAKQRAEIDRLIAETVAAEQALERSATDNRTQKPNAETKQQANKQLSAASFSNQLNNAAKKLKPSAAPLKN